MVGTSIGETLQIRVDALRATRASRDGVRRRQRRRLADHLAFVTEQSRFYKRRYADVADPIEDFADLPPVTKPALMDNFDDVVTDTAVTKEEVDAFVADESAVGHRFLDRYPVWLTAGTTGEPGVFLQDDRALTVADAVGDRGSVPALLDVELLARVIRQNARAAEIAVGGGHYAGASGVAMFRRERPWLRDRLRLFSPTQSLTDLVADLDAYQPAIVVGYSSVLVELARAQRAGRLHLSPAIVVPSGEPITDAEKRELRRAFDCAVREHYGATEFYAIAGECPRGNLHVNADWVVLEPVDGNYRPVDPGEPSDTVLLTNLANRIQPIVRYDLGDSVTMYAEPCPCDSPFPVIEVEGRQGDVLHFETADGERVPVFPLALTSVVEDVTGVHRTQIVRTDVDTLRVRLDVTDEASEREVWADVERAVSEFLQGQGIAGVDVTRSATAPERDRDSGKFRHVWSTVD